MLLCADLECDQSAGGCDGLHLGRGQGLRFWGLLRACAFCFLVLVIYRHVIVRGRARQQRLGALPERIQAVGVWRVARRSRSCVLQVAKLVSLALQLRLSKDTSRRAQ